MKIKVGKVTHNVGYALWKLPKLEGETDQEFLDRAIGMDNALRECDEARSAELTRKYMESHNS